MAKRDLAQNLQEWIDARRRFHLSHVHGAAVIERRDPNEDPGLATLAAVLINFPDDRRVILLERTCREGICLLAEPAEDEIALMRSGDLWKLWNSHRATRVSGIL